jgi:8-oxo-dGTP diphosphatase
MLYVILEKVWKRMPVAARTLAARSFQTKFTVSAAAVVTNDNGEVLLLNHRLRPYNGWGVPGGFLDRGEQADEAVRREIREETGIELADIKIYRIRTLRRHIEIIFTARGIGDPRVLSSEISELAWFPPGEMPEEMSVDQQFVIRKALGLA